MKTDVETLNPTRVKLTVEVPFEELQPSLDAAYKKIGSQVAIPGFRKGKIPPRLIDQRFGRAMVLEEAVNDALPRLYGQAVEQGNVLAIGRPEVDVTELEDGQRLTFTAEVDVRPEFELPAYDNLQLTVDDAEVTDEDVDKELDLLRERFASLVGVDRAAADGDFVSINLSATADGEAIDGLTARNMSYQVGSGALLDGLDDAVSGLSAGESKDFTTTLVGGEHAGQDVVVTVELVSVKEQQLPELDDEFAELASEFDSIDELRADIRARVERVKKLQQGAQAQDKAVQALLDAVDIPLPESVIAAEVESRWHSLDHQLEAAQMSREDFLAAESQTEQEFGEDLERTAREALKTQFILDKIVEKEQLSVTEAELTQHLLRTAARYGMSPDQFAQEVVRAGQVPMLVSEVVRNKALALAVEQATITDASGRPVDLEELRPPAPAAPVEMAEDAGETADQDTSADEDAEQPAQS